MDRIIEPKKGVFKYKKAVLISGIALFIILTIYGLASSGESLKVDGDRLRTSVVSKQRFDDVIALQGRVEPLRSFFLDAIEGGTVQEVYVEAGEQVEKGQALLKLTNTSLMLDFMNRETQIIEQINNLRNTRIQMELNERQLQEQVLDIAFERENMQRQHAIDTSLYSSNVIAKQDYENSLARNQYLERKQVLLEDGYVKNKAFRSLQMERIDQSIEMMERNLQAIRLNLENLTVKAPINGQLTSLNADIGESKQRGENLGRIDVLDGYLIMAQVDEHFLSRVNVGQSAYFTTGGARYELVLSKVYPEVSSNQFEVEFSFKDSIPQDIRRGQGLNLRLALSQSSDAVLIKRGAFYSSSGGKWVFVMNNDATEAYKRNVKLGRQNPDYIEVLEGLEPGETVITSSYDTYSDYEKIQITRN